LNNLFLDILITFSSISIAVILSTSSVYAAEDMFYVKANVGWSKLTKIKGMKSKNDNIGHSAHFGGAVGGYVITLIEQPQLLVDHTEMVVLLTIPILVLFMMQRLGKL
jgi:hypothetical protein